ncbi:ATP-dependent DNA helicase [Cocleimonas flava]|uniref:DNA 5'-3' helicase n=1 Tax=Cocleimonas flava TaxID=634765 RepID=A0A4V2P945_9GAMM|nr:MULTISPECIES: ATP-dependent DNA helicase [Cocleimonas]MEB8434109.1 ATP-dependent DNA helicase [Cocleimonas sp. KMM 6892]MEC4717031.1 ATP-dependent DNA helicase [Cocleimonas sp. KMM 6895]MEC4746381.1 ATP-dependent DNA helicase [Cocleimonas sp. KMM 6896]TCJ88215.1 ATP-dependent DNA helicase DinG [Cocleimonas flava]
MGIDLDDDWKKLLSDDGPLAAAIPGFQVRDQQQQMMEAVGEAIQNHSAAVIEAGTGVGKTFAYLVPAIASGGRIIVSTGTKTLQDQLFAKDLPVVKNALKTDTQIALLKGRANYLCRYRLGRAQSEGQFDDRRTISHLQRIADWEVMTYSGDIGELNSVPRDAEVWQQVTSTADNCLGTDCEDYDSCFVVKARREAQEADVVVVNHHLFFADLALKEEGFGELLPSANAVILDEAHQLPEVASTFFSETLSSRQLIELGRDTLAEVLSGAADMTDLRDDLRELEKCVLDLRLAMDKPGLREPWYKIKTKPAIEKEIAHLSEILDSLYSQLKIAAERSKGLESCYERIQIQVERLRNLNDPKANTVQWYETYTRSFSLVSTPLDIADTFKKHLESWPCAWILTSATIAVGKSFDHFTQRIGMESPKELLLDSPFDYWHNSLLYAPPNIPEPQNAEFVPALVEAAIPVIKASGGRTFMLFTSYRALNEAAELLRGEIDYPILVQGDSSQGDMIDNFRKLGNAVLLGTSSFWEGVDVRGEALSCVIIDKLPFASPGDPVLEARIKSIREAGGNPFFEYQLPQAVIALKQGVGRLIRDDNDTGLLMICDPRLRTKSYGNTFLESMPRVPRTSKLEVVERFFEHLKTKKLQTESPKGEDLDKGKTADA